MHTIGIDPGTTRTALVVLNDVGVPIAGRSAIHDNADIVYAVRYAIDETDGESPDIAIEQVQSYGMAVGAEVFETVRWAGRIEQAASDLECEITLLPRREIKQHLCGSITARDSNIRQAIIDRFGGQEVAIGNVRRRGPLHGFRADLWAALAVALTRFDVRTSRAPLRMSTPEAQTEVRTFRGGPATLTLSEPSLNDLLTNF